MKKSRILLFGAVLLTTLPSTLAQVLFSDDFEGGLGKWSTGGTTWSALTLSTARNLVPGGGTQSALVSSTLNRMYASLGQELSGHVKATYYLYDPVLGGTASNRGFGEVRAYTGPVAVGTLDQLFAIGKYSSVTMPGETFKPNKYQGRVFAGASAGWFNLDGDGSPNRSVGWHKFEIERLADGATVNYYVDGVLSRTITGAANQTLDSVVIGSVGSGSSAAEIYFDGVSVVPEPQSFALVAGLGLLSFALWRRRDGVSQ